MQPVHRARPPRSISLSSRSASAASSARACAIFIANRRRDREARRHRQPVWAIIDQRRRPCRRAASSLRRRRRSSHTALRKPVNPSPRPNPPWFPVASFTLVWMHPVAQSKIVQLIAAFFCGTSQADIARVSNCSGFLFPDGLFARQTAPSPLTSRESSSMSSSSSSDDQHRLIAVVGPVVLVDQRQDEHAAAVEPVPRIVRREVVQQRRGPAHRPACNPRDAELVEPGQRRRGRQVQLSASRRGGVRGRSSRTPRASGPACAPAAHSSTSSRVTLDVGCGDCHSLHLLLFAPLCGHASRPRRSLCRSRHRTPGTGMVELVEGLLEALLVGVAPGRGT